MQRRELPESLPRYGREAEMPYERFVEFVIVEVGKSRGERGGRDGEAGGGEERSCDELSVGRGECGVRFRSDVCCVRLRRATAPDDIGSALQDSLCRVPHERSVPRCSHQVTLHTFGQALAEGGGSYGPFVCRTF